MATGVKQDKSKTKASQAGEARSGGEARGVAATRGELPLHRSIYQQLLQEVQNGTWKVGSKLPSEAALCERFGASRITVAKAIGTLQREGLVRRRAGSGTFVQQPPAASTASLRFGLLIPDLGATEIFEPICRGMMLSPLTRPHSLVWGHAGPQKEFPELAAEDLCRQFIEQRLHGVFFAPVEYAADRHAANHRIVEALERAGIVVVLLDRCVERFPARSRFDLVGIDNHRAGALLTQHVIAAGAKRPVFLGRARSAGTVHMRASGYWTAVRDAGLEYDGAYLRGDLDDPAFLCGVLERERPDALICQNDHAAAVVMRSLVGQGVAVPGQVRVAGFDDVKYAEYLPVPLTTIRQDCAELGQVAMLTMLERLRNPGHPARDVLVDFELVVRESTR
ncbi:GntR family transcriptional regulator [Terriglobus aquaticus]|uniref:GntR family transcriptional regulator n=1 Tax=Terriglobus aquaticus TaxID=940139 RepID=A0ABW9KG64_9BACT|nr:GntR family transcriptional regulator [Terriglobus aquaticus]